MWLLLFSFLSGILMGGFLPLHIPVVWGRYVSVALLAGLDSVLGAGKAVFENRYHSGLFVSGFLTNIFLAGLLTYIGDRLGVELYLAAVITFGVRIFQDLSIIRVHIYEHFSTRSPQGEKFNAHETP